jgi:LysM domain
MRSIEHPFERKGRTMTSPSCTASSPTYAAPAVRRPSPARLTRRGRIVVVAFVMLLLIVAAFTLGRGSSQASGRHRTVQHTVTVEAGESLWSVAARIAPHDDPRLVVADIQSLNHLGGPTVVPGEQLIVPTIG